ncbi:MAG: hypothetical protein JNM68_05680 [Dinghuibacter sp.]|nr:hypothetical protein [Dinghuibacter sp.]
MDQQTIILSVIIAALLVGITGCLFYIQKIQRKQDAAPLPKTGNPQLQLAAYERLTLFAERSKLNNLITRLYQPHFTARDMQQQIVSAIKEEFDYNISQQLYVSPEIWDAVSKLKEQNIYITNQITASLPRTATALDLNKHLIEFTLQNPKSTMNQVVLEALHYEAQRLI